MTDTGTDSPRFDAAMAVHERYMALKSAEWLAMMQLAQAVLEAHRTADVDRYNTGVTVGRDEWLAVLRALRAVRHARWALDEHLGHPTTNGRRALTPLQLFPIGHPQRPYHGRHRDADYVVAYDQADPDRRWKFKIYGSGEVWSADLYDSVGAARAAARAEIDTGLDDPWTASHGSTGPAGELDRGGGGGR
jgi:hypothetical protein